MATNNAEKRREARAKRRAKRLARPDRGHKLSAIGFALAAVLAVVAVAIWGDVLLTR